MPPSPPSSQTPQWRSDAALLLVVLIWGVNFPVLKAALQVMPLLVVNAFRFIVSVSVLGFLYYWRQRDTRTSFWAPLRQHGWQILGLGMVGYVLYQYFFIFGLDATTAGSSALIMASAPLWTALIGHVMHLEYLQRASWIGLAVTLAGTIIIVLGGANSLDFSSSALVGNLLMLAASICWGAYTALNKPLLRHLTPTGLTFFGLCFALPILVGTAIPSLDDVAWTRVDLWVWLAILFSGGLSTGIAFIIWNQAVKNVGASQTAVFGNLVPFVALFSGYLFLNEPIFAPQLLGGAFIIGGLLLTRRTRLRTRATT